MKYNAKELKNGNFAVFTGDRYFAFTERPTQAEAHILSLQKSACWYRDQADKAHKELEGLGAVDSSDPYGYLA